MVKAQRIAPRPVHQDTAAMVREGIDVMALPYDVRERLLRFETATDLLVNEGWYRIHRYFVVNCCITAARIACDLYEHAGINASPLVVDSIAVNDRYRTRAEQAFGRMPQGEDEERFVLGDPQADARGCIAALLEDTEEGYSGHVIVRVNDVLDREWIVDLSAPQMGSDKLPIVSPILAEIAPGADLLGGTWLGYDYPEFGVAYKVPDPTRNDYRECKAWTDDYRLVLNSLIRKFDRNWS